MGCSSIKTPPGRDPLTLQYRHLNQSQGGGSCTLLPFWATGFGGGDMKEFNNWIPAQLPLGWGEPVMLALASVAAQVPALGVAQGWCSC